MFQKSLFLTEKVATQNPRATSIVLLKESARRYPTYMFEASELYMENGKVIASAHKVRLDKKGNLVCEEKTENVDLSKNCLVSVRLEPPFDQSYFTAMHMLTKLGKGGKVVNDPAGIIAMPEKLLPNDLQKFAPPTLITSDMNKIREFWAKHNDIILKPLYEFGGRNVFRLKKGDENHLSILRMFKEKYKEPVIAQKYLADVKKGDKRVMFLDGEVKWQVLRVPAKGTLQASADQGATLHKTTLTNKEKQICEALRPILKKNNIFFCGIDIIGGYLTEVNVTCPALFTPINELYNIKAEKIYWDKLEQKLKKH